MCIVLSITEFVLLLRVKPFKDKCDNRMAMANEAFLSTVYVLLGSIQFTASEKSPIAVIIGYVILGVVLLANLFNILVFLVKKILDCKHQAKIKKRRKVLVMKARHKLGSSTSEFLSRNTPPTHNPQDLSHMMCKVHKQSISTFYPRRGSYDERDLRGPREVQMKLY